MTSHHVIHSMKIRVPIFIHPNMSYVMIDMLYKVLGFKHINQACLVYQNIHYDTWCYVWQSFCLSVLPYSSQCSILFHRCPYSNETCDLEFQLEQLCIESKILNHFMVSKFMNVIFRAFERV
jgi:hypothetical protein